MLQRVHRAERLELIVTRRCNFRCSYCHVDFQEKTMSWEVAERALSRFFALSRHPRLLVKLFGGEPTLEADLVEQVIRFARDREPGRVRFELSTNGSMFDERLFDIIAERPDVQVRLSLDGTPARQREQRRVHLPLAGEDSYAAPLRHLDRLLALPDVVVNHTVSPRAAASMVEDWRHLVSLGFRRFYWLPVYYHPWSEPEVQALRDGFAHIATEMQQGWRAGEPFEVMNLFTRARVSLFWEGVVVDADGSVFAGSAWAYRPFHTLRERLRIGHVSLPGLVERLPPSREQEDAWMRELLPRVAFESTRAVDAALTEFVRAQTPHRLAFEARRRIEAARKARA